MTQDEYETELTGSRTDVAAAIHGVADGVLAGAIRLEDGADSVTVDTPESLSLEIELESDDDEVSLELELEWSAAAVDAADAGSAESPTEESIPVAEEQPDPDVAPTDSEAETGMDVEAQSDAEARPDADAASNTTASGETEAAHPPETMTHRSPSGDDHTPESDADSLPDATAVPVGAADASQSLARFEVFRDRREEWRWRLRHRNGNVIATSGEGYTRKHNAWKGLRSVMANSSKAAVVEESPE